MKIVIHNINKSIKNNIVLNSINMQMESGLVYGLVGNNGSGKTMLMRSICGLIKVDSGYIKINDQQLGKDIDVPESLGAIIEHPGFFDFYTGYKNLEILARIRNVIGKKEIEDAMNSVGLKYMDKRKVGKYSLGMKQRLAIAQAIMENPELLILDEPTNGLDDDGVHRFREIILQEKQRKKLILIASHNSEDIASLSDVILKMDQGKLSIVKEK